MRTEAARSARLFSAYTCLLSTRAVVSCIMWASSHMAASSWMWFVSQASLKVVRNSLIKIGSIVLEKGGFICDLTFLASLAIQLEIVSSQRENRLRWR